MFQLGAPAHDAEEAYFIWRPGVSVEFGH
jgi:hypothetical protein